MTKVAKRCSFGVHLGMQGKVKDEHACHTYMLKAWQLSPVAWLCFANMHVLFAWGPDGKHMRRI